MWFLFYKVLSSFELLKDLFLALNIAISSFGKSCYFSRFTCFDESSNVKIHFKCTFFFVVVVVVYRNFICDVPQNNFCQCPDQHCMICKWLWTASEGHFCSEQHIFSAFFHLVALSVTRCWGNSCDAFNFSYFYKAFDQR